MIVCFYRGLRRFHFGPLSNNFFILLSDYTSINVGKYHCKTNFHSVGTRNVQAARNFLLQTDPCCFESYPRTSMGYSLVLFIIHPSIDNKLRF